MQLRNHYKKTEDFLADESFKRWVRYHENAIYWETWTLESPERAKLVEEARLWLLAMQVKETPISKQETQVALHDTWQKISDLETTKPILSIWKSQWFRAAAATVIIGFGGLCYYLYQPSLESSFTYTDLIEQDTDGLIEQTNNSAKPQLITLSDASSVLLQPKSKLSYPKTFSGEDRKVYLSGEAFFEINKNPKKPFFVYANEVITKVYGTSFRVIAYANQSTVEVLVRTGKVKVSSNQDIRNATKEEVTLLANQAARFVRKELSFEKILDVSQDKPLLLTAKPIEQLSFEFNDVPVEQILRTIEQAYLVKIDFPIEKLKNCYLTTSLSDEPLPEKLKIVCESLGNNTQYEMNGNQITIISKGCN